MNPFKQHSFDTIIGKGTSFFGQLILASGSTTIVDGIVIGSLINETILDKPNSKTTLVINGNVSCRNENDPLQITVQNVTVTGKLQCGVLTVNGTLAVKKGAVVQADKIQYRNLIMEPGAVMMGQMVHLDHKIAENADDTTIDIS